MNTANRIMSGTSYYPDHWPQTDWERDMKLIKESGLDIIRFGEFSWNWYEPEEGKFDFSGYDVFMELAYKLGLYVVLCTPTASAPAWMLYKYPDVKLIDQFGRKNKLGRHMVCYNHPTARELAERAIIVLAERYKDHPSLFGWQIDNEPCAGESAEINKLYDYHPETVKLFKEYIRNKYKDLSSLNYAWQNNFWSRSYSDWEQIEPPQSPDIPGLWLEWMRFRDSDVANLILWQSMILRNIKKNFIIGTNIPESGYASVLFGQNYWQQCKGLDYVGTDLYDYNHNWEQSKRNISFSCDMIRSAANAAGAEFWISETPSGPAHLPWRVTFAGGTWGKEWQRFCVNEYVAHGAKKILFFLWRPAVGGCEFGGNGMVNFDGTPNEMTRSMLGIMEDAQQEKDKVIERPIIYIHYSRDSLLLARGYDPDDRPWSTIVGWYDFAIDLGYRVEFINDEVLKNKQWKKGEVCILPYSTVMDTELINAVKNAIKQGIKLIAGFGTGYFNEYGTIEYSASGRGLDVYFGVKIKNFDILPKEQAPNFIGNEQVAIDVIVADINIIAGEIILKDSSGKPLVVKNSETFYFAFDFGTLYKNSDLNEKIVLRNLIQDIFELRTVDSPKAADRTLLRK